MFYSDVGTIVEASREGVAPAAFTGIAVGPSGEVALNDQGRRQIIRLWPKGVPR